MTPTADIGIDGLPAPLGTLHQGQMYAVSAPDAALSLALTVGAARAALAARRRILLVVENPAAIESALLRAGIDVTRAHKRGGLRLFGWSAHSARAARLGPAQLLDELDAFGCDSDTLVWLWPAHQVLRWDPPAALKGFARLYHGWAQLFRNSLVFLFSAQGADEGHAQQLASHYPALAGLALIHGDRRDACWETRRWPGTGASGTGNLSRLQLTDDGRLVCPPDLTAQAENWRRRIIEAPDRDTVYIAAAAASDARAGWTVLADAAEIERRAAHAVGATCVFGISASQELRALAQSIHSLRSSAGRGVRLFVRECGFRLRHGQVQLLLALGANAIITPAEATADVVAAWRERPFAGPLSANFESALRRAVPPTVGGERDPAAFAEHARRLARRAEEAGLACALLSFQLGAGVSAAEVRDRCRPTRSGDLFCTENGALHLFLYGCWPEDIDTALRHILRGSLELLFDGQVRNTEPTLMQAALDNLAARARRDSVRPEQFEVAALPERASRAVQTAPLERRGSHA